MHISLLARAHSGHRAVLRHMTICMCTPRITDCAWAPSGACLAFIHQMVHLVTS